MGELSRKRSAMKRNAYGQDVWLIDLTGLQPVKGGRDIIQPAAICYAVLNTAWSPESGAYAWVNIRQDRGLYRREIETRASRLQMVRALAKVRATAIRSAIAYARAYGFSGLSLAYES